MIEPLILSHLIRDEEFARKVLPHLKGEYFTTPAAQKIFADIHTFVASYKTTPTLEALTLALEKSPLSGGSYEEATRLLTDLQSVTRVDAGRRPWLVDETEKFCKQRALYLAISDAIGKIDNNFEDAGGVPDMLRDALSVGFHTHIGHDYFDDASARYDLLHQKHTRIPFDLDLMNTITAGGLTPKTLNIVAAGCVHPSTPVRIRFRKRVCSSNTDIS